MKCQTTEFPFTEVRQKTGDYFDSIQQAVSAGFAKSQIWSVTVTDDVDDNGREYSAYSYGPSHHWVNVMGYVATHEHHDGETYYEETVYMDEYR